MQRKISVWARRSIGRALNNLMDKKEEFMQLLAATKAENADAIVLLAGDLFHRVPKAAELHRSGYAPFVVVTSNALDETYGSLPSNRLVPELLRLGVATDAIISEETAAHTRAEAESTMRIARERGWKSLILVTTEYHQYRAFLTWLKTMQDLGMDLRIMTASVEEFPSFKNETREQALVHEFERISAYQEKGHVADWTEGVEYLLEKGS